MSEHQIKLTGCVIIPGFVPGASASLHMITLVFTAGAVDPSTSSRLVKRITSAAAIAEGTQAALNAPNPLLGSIVAGTSALLHGSGKPRFPMERVLFRHSKGNTFTLGFQLPANCNAGLRMAVQTVLDVVNDESERKGAAIVKRASTLLERQHPLGINPKVILEYAAETGVAITSSTAHYYMLGLGKQARWLASSITDRTSSMGVSLARDKFQSLNLLRQAGLPVPKQRLVQSLAGATAAAQTLGYPLVLKPVALDKGKGVIAGIHTEAMLHTAYEYVAAISGRMVLEQFVDGLDLRFTVVNGKSQRIVARLAAAVVGDGAASIADLITCHNQRAIDGEPMETGYPIHRMEVDWETEHWLANQGLTMESVPAAGHRVRLKGAANLSTGGTAFYALDVHPDLIALAERAVRVLHLDIGAVDMLVPDYTVPWREQTVGICEINAQPQLSWRTMMPLFQSLLPTGGRVPVVAVLGTPDEHPWYTQFQDMWAAREHGQQLGTAHPGGIWLEQEFLAAGGNGAYADGMVLALEPQMDAMLLFINEPSSLHTGMPVNQVDMLVLPAESNKLGQEWRAGWLKVYQDMCAQVISLEAKTSTDDIANLVQQVLSSPVAAREYREATP